MTIFLYGDDTRRSREKLKALTDKFLKDVDPSGINLTQCDGAKLAPEVLGQLLSATPFLARRRMVTIEGLFQNKDKAIVDVLEGFLQTKASGVKNQESGSDDTIVVLWEDGTPKHAVAKKLSKLPLAEHFETLEKEDAPEWIAKQLKQWDVAIDPAAARSLAERFPGNTWALATELHKLASYARRDPRVTSYELRVTDVDALAGTFAEEPLYMLTAAIEAGSLPQAAQRLHTFLDAGTPLFVLMSMVGKLLSNLAAEKRGGLAELKLHPYVEKKIHSLSRRISTQSFAELLEQFLCLEYKLKTIRVSGEVELLRFLGHATSTISPQV